MNCSTVQNLLSAYLDCELDIELKREMRKHLFSCPECHQACQDLQQLKSCLESLEIQSPEIDPLDNLYLRLDEEKHLLVSHPAVFQWGSRVVIAAACIGLFFISALKFFPLDNQTVNPLVKGDEQYNTDTNAASFDRNLSLDKSVTVYQASAVLP